MGKSTTAGFFRDAGVPVWDADAAVHRLYAAGGAAVAPLAALVPDAATEKGIDRGALKAAMAGDPALLSRIEAIVHPLVAADRAAFVDRHAADGVPLIVCDIPLLYETGGEAGMSGVLVVTAPAAVQRQRVLERPGMTDEMFDTILSRQMPDAEKRARADFVIDTSGGLNAAREAVMDVIAKIGGQQDA
ncbi:dephospho-CoA kinase [Rhodobacteraceae bacterium KN286]|uniref:Dephospho-CoA kinase n=2 Tax=Oceanomicrobium pacificus TaxID=2692916 RepID=A0A6B0TPX0_9RHOB|nr:dephospho-CoA kinase [Oceanomicrobium pacificus]